MKIKLFCKLAVLCFFFTVLAAKKNEVVTHKFSRQRARGWYAPA